LNRDLKSFDMKSHPTLPETGHKFRGQ